MINFTLKEMGRHQILQAEELYDFMYYKDILSSVLGRRMRCWVSVGNREGSYEDTVIVHVKDSGKWN